MNPKIVENDPLNWSAALVVSPLSTYRASESDPEPVTPSTEPDTDAPGRVQPSPGPTTDPFANPDPDGDDEPCRGPCRF